MRVFCFNVFLVFLFISCNKFNDQTEKRLKNTVVKISLDSTSYSLKLYPVSKEIHFEEIPRTVPYDSIKNKNYADLIMNDSIVVLHSFKPYYVPLDK